MSFQCEKLISLWTSLCADCQLSIFQVQITKINRSRKQESSDAFWLIYHIQINRAKEGDLEGGQYTVKFSMEICCK